MAEIIRSTGTDGLEVLSNILDRYTGEQCVFKEMTAPPPAGYEPFLNIMYLYKYGKWFLRDYSELKFSWFGAKTSATASANLTAMQLAIDFLIFIGGGGVILPKGNLNINGTLGYGSNIAFYGDSKGSSTITQTGGGLPIFKAKTAGISTTFHTYWYDITINNVFVSRPMPVGSVGIDMREHSQGGIFRCRFRYHQNAILGGDDIIGSTGGFYNTIMDCEIASNDNGIYMGISCNSWVIEGGRINGNLRGIILDNCSGARINTTFERNDTGVEFKAGAFKNAIVGGYFEGNAQYQVGQTPPPVGYSAGDYIPGCGAVVFDLGSYENQILSAKFTNSTDAVLDLDSRNTCQSNSTTSYSPSAKTGNGNNILYNGLMERDSNGDGLADGWTVASGIPAGTTVALDTSVKKTGTQSQRITLAAAGTSQRTFQRVLRGLTIGVPHCFSCFIMTDLINGFNVRIGNTTASPIYLNAPVLAIGNWICITRYFVPTQETATVWIFQNAIAYGVKGSDANIWIDSLKVESGMNSSLPVLDKLSAPNGLQVARPTNPEEGDIYFNRDTSSLEVYFGTSWVPQGTTANTVLDATSTPLTKATLNAAYPTALKGFVVIQDGANQTYIKKDNSSTGNWSIVSSVQAV